MLAAAGERFEAVFVEKDDEPALVERYGVVYYPTFLWADARGGELLRTGQPENAEELLDDLQLALELLDDPAPADE